MTSCFLKVDTVSEDLITLGKELMTVTMDKSTISRNLITFCHFRHFSQKSVGLQPPKCFSANM